MKRKSTVYNIHGNYLGKVHECEDIEDIEEIDQEYEAIRQSAQHLIGDMYNSSESFDVRIDQGCYHFLPNGSIELSKIPEIHVVVSGGEFYEMTAGIERLVSNNIYCTGLECFEIWDNALSEENRRKLNEHSFIRHEYCLACANHTKSISEQYHKRIINVVV